MSSSFTLRPILVALSAAGLALGLALRLFGQEEWAAWVWGAFTAPVLLALLIEIVLKLRSGEVGLDIVAALSMTAALVFGEELAAVVVALMYPKVPTPDRALGRSGTALEGPDGSTSRPVRNGFSRGHRHHGWGLSQWRTTALTRIIGLDKPQQSAALSELSAVSAKALEMIASTSEQCSGKILARHYGSSG